MSPVFLKGGPMDGLWYPYNHETSLSHVCFYLSDDGKVIHRAYYVRDDPGQKVLRFKLEDTKVKEPMFDRLNWPLLNLVETRRSLTWLFESVQKSEEIKRIFEEKHGSV